VALLWVLDLEEPDVALRVILLRRHKLATHFISSGKRSLSEERHLVSSEKPYVTHPKD